MVTEHGTGPAGPARRELDTAGARRIVDVAGYAAGPPEAIGARLAELDREWDVDRVVAAEAALVTLLGLALGLRSRRWLALAGVGPAWLLQRAARGAAAPPGVLGRVGLRTRGDIEAERTALQALRGDFDGVSFAADSDGPVAAARLALAAADRART